MSFMRTDANILKKKKNLTRITAKRIHHDKVGFFSQECKVGLEFQKINQCNSALNMKTCMTVLKDAGDAEQGNMLDKSNIYSLIKNS